MFTANMCFDQHFQANISIAISSRKTYTIEQAKGKLHNDFRMQCVRMTLVGEANDVNANDVLKMRKIIEF